MLFYTKPIRWEPVPQTKLNRGLCPFTKQRQSPCSCFAPAYQDLSTRMIGWVEKAIVDLPIKMKGNSKRTSGNSLSPLAAQYKNIGAAW